MHFLSTGREERIHRWLIQQLIQLSPAVQDQLENAHCNERISLDMEWELEELERQMAMSASAFAKEMRTSVDSTTTQPRDSSMEWPPYALHLTDPDVEKAFILDATHLPGKEIPNEQDFFSRPEHSASNLSLPKKSPPLKPEPLLETEELCQASVDKESLPEKEPFASSRERRRHGRIISQPPKFPPDEAPPMLFRSRTAPPPIAISRSPMTFIFQEFSSPFPSTINFTPTPGEYDTFPTTPRSFTSFMAKEQDQGLRSPVHPPTPMLLTSSPTSPYSGSAYSETSTGIINAFPPTPNLNAPWNLTAPLPQNLKSSSVTPLPNSKNLKVPFSKNGNPTLSSKDGQRDCPSRFSDSTCDHSGPRVWERAGSTFSKPPSPPASRRGLISSVSQRLRMRARSYSTLSQSARRTENATSHIPEHVTTKPVGRTKTSTPTSFFGIKRGHTPDDLLDPGLVVHICREENFCHCRENSVSIKHP